MPVNSFENYPMSWKPILDRSSRSLYQTLAKQLESDIASGVLRPGTKLPPQRELADYLDVNVSTISKAFKVCELKGLLSATVGSGTFVAYDALSKRQMLSERTGAEIVDMGATIPEPSGAALIAPLFQEAACLESLRYYSQTSVPWHRDAAVSFLARCGFATEPNRILFAGGGQNAIAAVFRALFHRNDRIAVNDHTYPGVKSAAALYGIQLVPVPSGTEGMDPQALEQLCRKDKIRGVFLIPGCHNPTTGDISPKNRGQIAGIIQENDCILIEDGAYAPISDPLPAVASDIPKRSVYIANLSKSVAPGLGISFLSVPERWHRAISDALYAINGSIVPILAETAARLIVSGKVDEVLEIHRRETRLRNALVDRYLSKEQCLGGGVDIFRWLKLPDTITGAAFENLALSQGVQVYGAERFSVGNTTPAHGVRLSICAPRTTDELERGLQILAELMK